MKHLGAGTVLQNYHRTVTIGQDTTAVLIGTDTVHYRGGDYEIVTLCEPTTSYWNQTDEDTHTYIFQADTYCERCAPSRSVAIRRQLQASGILATIRQKYGEDASLADETTYDSDDYPKGPYSNNPNYSNFTGYADSPVHCGQCGRDLKHPLYQG